MASSIPNPDITEITTLLKRERYHRDTAQWHLCREAYHPDASKTFIDVSWFQGPIDTFLQKSAHIHPGRINVIHSSFDPVDVKVAVDGTRATSEAFCLITSGITLDGVDYELASSMRLVTRLVRLCDDRAGATAGAGSGLWRIVRLEAIYIRDRLVCSFPGMAGGRELVLGEAVLAFPRAYRCMAFVMLRRGLSPRVDLPHEDDQEGVRRVLEGGRVFLEGGDGDY
ncbi:hypothetical protein BJX99DRAFT_254028 [Aspergillus californicus]